MSKIIVTLHQIWWQLKYQPLEFFKPYHSRNVGLNFGCFSKKARLILHKRDGSSAATSFGVKLHLFLQCLLSLMCDTPNKLVAILWGFFTFWFYLTCNSSIADWDRTV